MVTITSTDDAELLRRYARACDEAAFAELVQRYLSLVYHAALRQVGGDAPLAEEVAQTVFTRLLRRAAELSGHEALAGWLHTTTRYAASEARRAERRRRAREREAFAMEQITHDGTTDGDAVHWENLRPSIDTVLEELAAPDREVLLLRYFADLPDPATIGRIAGERTAARLGARKLASSATRSGRMFGNIAAAT